MKLRRDQIELIFATFNSPQISFPGALVERVAEIKTQCRVELENTVSESSHENPEEDSR